jgi:hypothetical protein
MLGFKRFRTAATTIAGIELLLRIRKGQFNLSRLRFRDRAAPAGLERRTGSPVKLAAPEIVILDHMAIRQFAPEPFWGPAPTG